MSKQILTAIALGFVFGVNLAQAGDGVQARKPITDSVERWAHAFNVGGQVADGAFSIVAFERGCKEGNIAIYGSHPSVARIVWTKALTIGGVYLAMKFAEKNGSTKIARALGYFSGGVGTGAAISNALQSCGGGR